MSLVESLTWPLLMGPPQSSILWPVHQVHHTHLLTLHLGIEWLDCTEVDIRSIMLLQMFLQECHLLRKKSKWTTWLGWWPLELHWLTLAASRVPACASFLKTQVGSAKSGPFNAAEHQANKATAMHERKIGPWEIIYPKRLQQMSTCCLVSKKSAFVKLKLFLLLIHFDWDWAGCTQD